MDGASADPHFPAVVVAKKRAERAKKRLPAVVVAKERSRKERPLKREKREGHLYVTEDGILPLGGDLPLPIATKNEKTLWNELVRFSL